MKPTGSGPPSSQKPAKNKQTKQKQTNKEKKANPPNIFVAGSLTSQELGLKLSLSEAAAVL